MSGFRLLGLMGTVNVKLFWKDGWIWPEVCLSFSPPPREAALEPPAPPPTPAPLGCLCLRCDRTGEAVIGEKLAGLKPNSGDGEGEGVGEKGDWLEIGEKDGVPDRELPSETSMVAASHSSKSKRADSSCGTSEGSMRRGLESPLLLVSLPSLDVSSQSSSLLALPRRSDGVSVPELLPPPRSPPAASISLVLIDRCLEQYPLRWDSFIHPSLEHSLRHCFPLNFLRIPLGVHTTSPFLYFCCANERGVLEREEVEEVGVGGWDGVLLDGGRLEVGLLISEVNKAGEGGG